MRLLYLFSQPLHYRMVRGKLHTLISLPQGEKPNTHSVGDWVGPRAGLYILEKREIWDYNPRFSSP
jgi:hypothetical protein